MILINLLPHREENRKRRRAAFFVGIGMSAAVGAVIVGAIFLLLQYLTVEQQHRNQYLKSAIQGLEIQIKDIANLRAEIDALKSRQKAVEDLQTDRNTPVHLLEELARDVPEGVYLTTLHQNGKVVEVGGYAQSNDRVSELLRNTSAQHNDWLEKPDLVEIKLADLKTTGRDPQRLFAFTMRISIKAPAGDVPAGASAPASGAKTNKV
ncbi:MAG: PilN domain-containing protein [Paucibacter sp.]|nr:PilN domain-containing protein [Roseateles sp.]MBV8379920.1 PilN domain-containing protein [Roseateles sp.]